MTATTSTSGSLDANLRDALQAAPGPQLWAAAAAGNPTLVANRLVADEATILPRPVVVAAMEELVRGPLVRTAGGADRLAAALDRHLDLLPGAVIARGAGLLEPTRARAVLQRALRTRQEEPALLRAAADLAVRAGDAPQGHALLTRLGRADGAAATVQAVRRLRERLPVAEPNVRIALLSTCTVDLLAAYVDLELRSLGLEPAVYIAPFNTIPIEVRNSQSGLYATEPDVVFISAMLDDLVPDLASGLAGAALADAGARAVEELVGHVQAAHDRSGAILVVQSLWSAFIGASPVEWGAGGRGRWLRDLNGQLREALGVLPRVHVLDMDHVAASRPDGPVDNAKMRYMAGMRLGEGVVPALARSYVRYVVPTKGLTRKCLVLDCDNTLWGGIVGEDGPDGIRLGNTSPGVEYRDFQLAIAALAKRGVLLAVNSKNNPDDALEVIRHHPWMVLREEDFSAVRINWESKVENLRTIAAELNIGLDSLVFVDDNPVECEQVRALLPEVVTVQMPRDPSRYRATLDALPWFETFAVTPEDLQRAGQYRASRSREALRVQRGSVEDYLHSLEIRIGIAPASRETLARVVQLVNRTNQFNLTTRRYSQAEVEGLLTDSTSRIWTLRARDRFGDHGLVALAVTKADGEIQRIDSFLMSCRVIGQGLEDALLAHLHAVAVASGARVMQGEYRPTKKNAQVRTFFETRGFAVHAHGSEGATTYDLPLPASLTTPAWITVESE